MKGAGAALRGRICLLRWGTIVGGILEFFVFRWFFGYGMMPQALSGAEPPVPPPQRNVGWGVF